MNYYIVIGDDGWYVSKIKQKNPLYKGIDRFPWPLCKENIEQINHLPTEEKNIAESYLAKLSNVEVLESFIEDFSYTKDYYQLCGLLDMNVELYMVIPYFDVLESNRITLLEELYSFVGFDYILKNSTYSSIVHEKHLCDDVKKLTLNENGLFNSYLEAHEYSKLRDKCKKIYNIEFEKGDCTDFQIIKLYKYKEN